MPNKLKVSKSVNPFNKWKGMHISDDMQEIIVGTILLIAGVSGYYFSLIAALLRHY